VPFRSYCCKEKQLYRVLNKALSLHKDLDLKGFLENPAKQAAAENGGERFKIYTA